MTHRTGKGLIITIDGPSGAGKSTAAKLLAKTLDYTYIDTGAMYRGIAYAFRESGTPGDMAGFLKDLSLRFELGKGMKVFFAGRDITDEIRQPGVSLLASNLSQNKNVREHLWRIQREIGGKGRVVLEGRDTGSVVFPDAHVKFYIDANLTERAKRRHLELASKGVHQEQGAVKTEMAQRDKNDSERDIAPLRVPDGAIRIDTTGINAEQVVERMMGHILRVGEEWK